MSSSSHLSILPVILAGGKSTRLWPLSTSDYPKQFLSLTGNHSLLEQTLLRCQRLDTDKFLIVGNFEHRFLLGEQVQSVGLHQKASILLEPIGRDSALPLALSCLYALKQGLDPILCVMPADAAILEEDKGVEALKSAVKAASSGYLTVIGLKPTRPETGYGYIETGHSLECGQNIFRVASFKEKPDSKRAEEFIQEDKYLWNSGMFVVQASTLKKSFEDYAPETLKAAEQALQKSTVDLDFIRLNVEAFNKAPSISFDYAVMEHTNKAAVVKADFGWTDLGNWKAVKDLSRGDDRGNVIHGQGIIHSGHGNYIRSDNKFVAVNGLNNIGVIATEGTILVSDLSQIQDIKDIVKEADRSGFQERQTKVLCPWGYFETLVMAEDYQVKRITVKPHKRLSLQKHAHRSEHWLVISGKAIITLEDKEVQMNVGESISIPVGSIHRLENALGDEMLVIIEVQRGSYLGEDDIIRLEDDFQRV